ncbi:MAG: sulfatase [Thermoplasmata archaeon]|nr:sulfatase [Thermoplasmata archaeon]
MLDRPNVVIVVLDCVRSPDFPPGDPASPSSPNVARLIQESVVFPRAYSVAPWTIPAHRSLSSGRYFWNLPSFRAEAAKDPALPSALSACGYSTAALLGNPTLGEASGFPVGFDRTQVAAWWEPYVRSRAESTPDGRRAPSRWSSSASSCSGLTPALELLVHASLRYPKVLEGVTRFTDKIRAPGSSSPEVTAPWIEPAFRRWLSGLPESVPGFCVVNLMDAHEPYYGSAPPGDGPRSSRQDRLGWVLGSWTPTPSELAALAKMYRGTFGVLDTRLGSIIDSLKASGRWENTLFIVVGDHGQSFGEHGMVFHNHRVDEQLLHIPLIVKFPFGEMGGTRALGRASLVDVAPTVLEEAGAPGAFEADGIPLRRLIALERTAPTFAASTGVEPAKRHLIPTPLRELLDGVRIAAYDGHWKLVVGPDAPARQLYEIDSDPWEAHDVWANGRRTAPFELNRQAKDVFQNVSGTLLGPARESANHRLALWGY